MRAEKLQFPMAAKSNDLPSSTTALRPLPLLRELLLLLLLFIGLLLELVVLLTPLGLVGGGPVPKLLGVVLLLLWLVELLIGALEPSVLPLSESPAEEPEPLVGPAKPTGGSGEEDDARLPCIF